ncbi:MAG: hypothetical protein ACYC91_17395 [Solirubrobacteraceae bacterium]
MSKIKLNWSAAHVSDRELTVELEGELSKDWKKSFRTTARLLSGGDWGEVTLKKQTVRVGDVIAGSEEKLRHHLESILAQANADQASEEAQDDPAAPGDDGQRETEPDGPDAEMTERFRSFSGGGGN